MAAKSATSGKNFWNKMLSAQKVKRILERRGFDTEAFRKDYESDTNRGPRKAARPTDREINAVESFLKSGNYSDFMEGLGTKSRPAADAALRRVVAWKGQGGVKTIRRKAAARS
jgi:hypothetical protein